MLAEMTTMKEGWLRKAGYSEQFMTLLYAEHNFGISYVLRIATSRRVDECDVKEVFTHLLRKTINLRMLPGMRDGQLWMRTMQHEALDFQTLTDADVNDVYQGMASYRYNLDVGPAWAVRFLPLSPKNEDYIKRTTMENADKKLKTLPHVCHIVMSFHHGITDGYTCVRIIRHILMLLNDVISETPIDDSQQYAQMLDIKRQDLISQELENAFKADPKLMDARVESLMKSFPEALLSRAYPQPSKTPPKIVCLSRILDSRSTANFISRCKKEGITVHTGFSSVIEASIVQALLDANFLQDEYTIGGLHCIDQRSYFNDVENAYGCAFGTMDVTTDVSTNIVANFWSHAKQYHAKFKDQQKRMNSMEPELINKLTGKNPFVFIDSQGMDSPPPKVSTYATSNMRDVTEILSNCGQNVDLLYYDWMPASQELGIELISCIHTFNGQLLYNVNYNTQLVDQALARKIADSIFEIFMNVVKQTGEPTISKFINEIQE